MAILTTSKYGLFWRILHKVKMIMWHFGAFLADASRHNIAPVWPLVNDHINNIFIHHRLTLHGETFGKIIDNIVGNIYFKHNIPRNNGYKP